jgi:hypothetical protein
VCSARLSCRSPPRLSRCRLVWPLEAGIGATPARRAKAASERTRPGCDQATSSWAATIGPTPGSSSSPGASARTCARISPSSSAASAVAASIRRARLRKTSRVASSSAPAEPERRTKAAAALEQPCERESAQLLAEPVGRGHDHAAQLHERLATDVDGAASGDQQQPQGLPPLPRAGKRERLAGERRPRRPDCVERVVLAA